MAAVAVVNLCIFPGMNLSFQLPAVKPTGAADASACAGTECTKNRVLKDAALCTTVADVSGWERSCFFLFFFFLAIFILNAHSRKRKAKKKKVCSAKPKLRSLFNF